MDDRAEVFPLHLQKLPIHFWKEKNLLKTSDFHLVIRPSFTLGGTGGGFVHDKDELDEALNRGCRPHPFMKCWSKKLSWAGKNLNWNCCEIQMIMS